MGSQADQTQSHALRKPTLHGLRRMVTLKDLDALEKALTSSDTIAREDETICLNSFEQLVALFTDKGTGYAACVRDRHNTREMDPPSCAGFDDALPQIRDNTVGETAEAPDLPRIE